MKHNWRITAIMLVTFFFAQVVGLLVTNGYIDVEKTAATGNVSFEELPLNIERPPVEEKTSFVYIISAVIIGTVILFLLMSFKFVFLWRMWYFLAVFVTMTIAFGAFLPHVWSAVIGIALTVWKTRWNNVFVHNITELFVYGGLAAIFVPIMNLFSGVMLLILISAYDMYAVWKSKHMIKLAKFQTKSKVFAGFFIPYKLPKVGKGVSVVKKKIKTAVLGGGDIGFPLIFAGIILKEFGFAKSLVIPVFATVALFLLLMYGKQDRFYPAMPFLSLGCLVGYLVVLMI